MRKPPDATVLRLLHPAGTRAPRPAVSYVCEHFLLKACFSKIDVIGLERIKAKVRAGKRLIFTRPSKRVRLAAAADRLFHAGVRTAIQAGDNLSRRPPGPDLRGCGAFMSVRHDKSFYSTHWIYDLLARALGQRPIRVTREQYSQLYPSSSAVSWGGRGTTWRCSRATRRTPTPGRSSTARLQRAVQPPVPLRFHHHLQGA